jgi:ribosomal protein L16 Arg81 hydroxylase
LSAADVEVTGNGRIIDGQRRAPITSIEDLGFDEASFDSFRDTAACEDVGFDRTMSNLLGPLGAGDFARKYEEKRPFHIRRNCSQSFESLKLGDLAQLLPVLEMAHKHNNIRMRGVGEWATDLAVNRKESPFLAYLDGASMVFAGLDAFFSSAAAVAEKMVDLLPSSYSFGPTGRCAPMVNLYATPGGGQKQTFGLHNDPAPVFIVQVSGQKVWRVQYEPSEARSWLGGDQAKVLGAEEAHKAALKVVMNPGDVLYIPTRHLHEGYTTGKEHSLSLSISAIEPAMHRTCGRGTELHKAVLANSPTPDTQLHPDISMRSKVIRKGTPSLKPNFAADLLNRVSTLTAAGVNRVAPALEFALKVLESNEKPSRFSELAASDDTMAKLSAGIVLRALGLAQFQRTAEAATANWHDPERHGL